MGNRRTALIVRDGNRQSERHGRTIEQATEQDAEIEAAHQRRHERARRAAHHGEDKSVSYDTVDAHERPPAGSAEPAAVVRAREFLEVRAAGAQAWVIRDAAMAAPKPLSMLTTATPAAQLLSMVSNGARPLNAAP